MVRVKQALRILEDRAVDQGDETDVARYTVVRVADDIVVDLMGRACGIDYARAAQDAISLTFVDVVIPLAGAATLILTKNTMAHQTRRIAGTSRSWSAPEAKDLDLI